MDSKVMQLDWFNQLMKVSGHLDDLVWNKISDDICDIYYHTTLLAKHSTFSAHHVMIVDIESFYDLIGIKEGTTVYVSKKTYEFLYKDQK